MTSEIRERRLSLSFASGWTAAKWDEAAEYVDGVDRATNGVKACDVVAARPDPPTLVVAEFKDFDDPAISVDRRASAIRQATSAELIEKLVRKTLDTLMGATFAHDQAHQRSAILTSWSGVIRRGSPRILVLFCIEAPRSQALAIIPWTAKLKQQLHCLGPDVHVIVTSRESAFDQLGVRYTVHGPAASDA